LAAGGTAAYLRWPRPTETTPIAVPATAQSSPVASSAPAAPDSGAAAAPASPPSFDVVRVSPEGSAVIAGRAQPGAEVVVRDGEREIGRARADQRGEFVVTPEARLPAGGRALTLAAREGSGPEVKSAESVVVVVPPQTAPAREAAEAPALALLLPQGQAAPRMLQAAPDRSRKLSLNTVDYDDKGEIRFSGSAPPATPLRVYVDNQPVGEAKTDAQGQWTLTPSASVPAGVHQFRVDQLAETGRVTGRVELPFQRTSAVPSDVASGRVVVQPGQNLWRIARYAYGAGIRYTVIYLANRDQIRDPRLIYPGQMFSTPAP
jgi:nucleoid-associated protein YgaU